MVILKPTHGGYTKPKWIKTFRVMSLQKYAKISTLYILYQIIDDFIIDNN